MEKKRIKVLKKLLGKNFIALFYRSLFFLSDESYVRFIYRLRMGRKLHLDNPTSFNEKLQYLKLYDRKSIYTKMADKLAVRDYVEEKIGRGHTPLILGVYSSFDEIDFDKLPKSFVLKTTHDSGSYVICPDKAGLDIKSAKRKLRRSLRRNYYLTTREYQYRDITPRIISEEFLGLNLTDYKFFCFNGEPKFMYIEEETGESREQAIFDMDFNREPFTMDDEYATAIFEKPSFFDDMRKTAASLSSGIPFLRVDLYYVRGRVYVGELTFYHYGGFIPFNPPEWDDIIGGYLDINNVKKAEQQ